MTPEAWVGLAIITVATLLVLTFIGLLTTI